MNIDNNKVALLTNLKFKYLRGETSKGQAKDFLHENKMSFTACEFAIAQQHLESMGISCHEILEQLPEIMEIFEGAIEVEKLYLSSAHPLSSYQTEVDEIKSVLSALQELKVQAGPVIRLDLYNKLSEKRNHFIRKQNWLYPALELKGFFVASQVMRTLDHEFQKLVDDTQKTIRLNQDDIFGEMNEAVISLGLDLMSKEEEILFPTAYALLSDEEFLMIQAEEKSADSQSIQNSKCKHEITRSETLADGCDFIITPSTLIGELLEFYPNLQDYLIEIASCDGKINNPFVMNTMKNIANVQMVAQRGGFETEEFISLLKKRIEE